MKICSKCGAHNSDENFFCVDCNERLDDPISASEKERIEESIEQNVEKLYNKTDPFAITLFYKIVGAVCSLGTVILAIMFFIALFTNRSLEMYYIGFIFLIFGAFDAFFPKITWALEKMRLSFTISDPENAEPSDFYLIFRKVGIIICAVIGIAIIVLSAFQLCQKTEQASPDDAPHSSVIIQRGDEYSHIDFSNAN